MDWGSHVTALGTTALKEKKVTFGIKDEDRLKHLSVLGYAGSGRGEFIASMAFQDIARGIGVVALDAKGNVAPAMMERFDASVADRLVYLDPAAAEHPFSWNVIDDVRKLPQEKQEAWMVRIIESVYQLTENPFPKFLAPELLKRKDATLVTFYRVLSESRFRKQFFEDDTERLKALEALFTAHPDALAEIEDHGRYIGKDTLVRNVLGQAESKFSLIDMNKGAVVIVNLEKIRMFPTRMTPLVRLFTEATLMAGEVCGSAAALYLQDAVRYLGSAEVERAFSNRMVALTVADTVIQETDREHREFALSRCGSIVSFATHRLDRPLIERAFYPYVDPEELEQLGQGEFVATLVVDGVRTRPFFGTALPLSRGRSASYQDLITGSREKYTALRADVDDSFQDDDDDGPGGPKRPAGFQDAFRAMFEKRARAAQGGAGAAAQSPAGAAPQMKPGAPAQGTSGGAGTPPQALAQERTAPQEKRPVHAQEVAEDILKQMLYVPAVS